MVRTSSLIVLVVVVAVALARRGGGKRGCQCSDATFMACAAGQAPSPNSGAKKACKASCYANVTGLSAQGQAMMQCKQAATAMVQQCMANPTGTGCTSNTATGTGFNLKQRLRQFKNQADHDLVKAQTKTCKDACKAQFQNQTPSGLDTCARASRCKPVFCEAEKEAAQRQTCQCLVASGQFAGLTCV